MPDDGDGADERRQSRGGGSTARSVYMLRNRTGVFSELEDSKGRNGLVCTSIRAVFSRRHLRNEETKCTEERGCRSCVRLWARVVRAGHELNLNGPGSSPCGSTGKHLTKKN